MSTIAAKTNAEHVTKNASSFYKKSGDESFFKPVVTPVIQTKLTVGAPDDPMEREADRIAEQVMQKRENKVQRKCDACAEEDNEKVQRKPAADFRGDNEISGEIANSIKASLGNGTPVQPATRTYMESGFGTDFSNVQIHTGSNAAAISSQLNARAFTTGNDIFFNKGEYAPETDDGKRLLAHELTHTIQQGDSNPTNTNFTSKTQTIQRQTITPDAPPSPTVTPPASPTVTAPTLPSTAPATTPAVATAPVVSPTTQPALTPQEIASRRATLMSSLGDITWISDAFTGLDTDAHPMHKMNMMSMLTTKVMTHLIPLINMASRVQSASTEVEFAALTTAIATYKAVHGILLASELAAVVNLFMVLEQLYVIGFLNGNIITKDPANPNRAGQRGLLEYQRGLVGTVNYVTRVNYSWTRSAAATAAGVTDWTDAERNVFKQAFQRQLNDVWDTRNASPFTPFRVEEPEDYLLKTSPLKWSNITAHMRGEVRDAAAAATPDFTVTVIKRDTTTESGLRPEVGNATGTFYSDNATDGYDAAGVATGTQHTLAHEWAHMSGQPDEYAENSAQQSADWVSGGSTGTTANSLGSNQWQACQDELNRRAADTTLTAAQRAQAATDLTDLTNHATDMDAATPGFQGGIFGTAHRADTTLPLPDGCFAVRGQWSGTGSLRLRPGAASQRGGTHISASAADAARLTDRGNQVHAYHREGILDELNSALDGQTTPRVQFEHNLRDMSLAEQLETLEGRLNSLRIDINAQLAALSTSPAPAGAAPAGDRPE